MDNTVTCANCGQTWDIQKLPNGSSFTCQCSTIVCVPAKTVESTLDGDELEEVEPTDSLVEVVSPRRVNVDSLAPIDLADQLRPDDPYSSGSQVNPAMMHAARSMPVEGTPDPPLNTTKRLKLVNQGVQLVLIGILISLLALVLLVVPWSIALFMVMGIIQMGAGMVVIAGLIHCLFAPKDSGSRPYSIAALSCTAGGSILLKIAEMIVSTSTEEVETPFLTMVAWSSQMAGTALFLFFLRKLALYTGQRAEADEAMFLAIFMCVLAGAGLIMGICIPMIGMAILIVFAALFIAHLIWLFQFITFLDKLKFRKPIFRKRSSTKGWSDARTES